MTAPNSPTGPAGTRHPLTRPPSDVELVGARTSRGEAEELATAGGVDTPAVATLLRFTAKGEPKPQGSARAFVVKGRAVVTSDNKNLRPWRNTVSAACQDALAEAGITEPITGPVLVALIFTVPKPKSRPKTRRTWPDVKPDLDKLVRGALDAIVDAGAIKDDAQVVELVSAKDYPGEGREGSLLSPGVHVVIEAVGA